MPFEIGSHLTCSIKLLVPLEMKLGVNGRRAFPFKSFVDDGGDDGDHAMLYKLRDD